MTEASTGDLFGQEFQVKQAPKMKLKNGTFSKLFRGWNELKVSGKLPERRSYHIGCCHNGYMYVFGG